LSVPVQVLVVDDSRRGMQLAEFLESVLPGVRRTSFRLLIAQGGVRINGQLVHSSRRLCAGDVVQVRGELAPCDESPAGRVPTVLHESATALVIDKPAGLPTVPDRSGKITGIHGLLAELRPGADLRIVHRLDRDTSGCLLIAKGLGAARHFDAAFCAGEVHKRYCALVHGVPFRPEFKVEAWLGPDPRRPGKVVTGPAGRRGFRAATTAVTLRRPFLRHALLELRPATGRGHQLRVHLAAAGHPIVGDADYGGQPLLLSQLKRGYKPRLGFAERPLVARTFLHAEQLTVRDVDGSEVAVTAPMPEDLTTALARLERFAAPG
jgi:RluA family pseudouridine synthase